MNIQFQFSTVLNKLFYEKNVSMKFTSENNKISKPMSKVDIILIINIV